MTSQDEFVVIIEENIVTVEAVSSSVETVFVSNEINVVTIDPVVSIDEEKNTITVFAGVPGPRGLKGEPGVSSISSDDGNTAELGSDGGVFVPGFSWSTTQW